MSAEAIENDYDSNLVPDGPEIPTFEGQDVSAVQAKITALATLDDDIPVFGIEDRVRLVGEFKCIGVRHTTDPKTGNIVRQQILTPVTVHTCPWNPENPHDNGVMRAR